MPNNEQIYIIVEEPIAEPSVTIDGQRDGRRDTGGGWDSELPRGPIATVTETFRSKRISLNVEDLKSQMQDLIAVVNDLFNPADPRVMPASQGLQLEEVTLSVTVNAEGQLSILGTGGKLGGSGGITLKLIKPKVTT
jgi:hypothetical protein